MASGGWPRARSTTTSRPLRGRQTRPSPRCPPRAWRVAAGAPIRCSAGDSRRASLSRRPEHW
eukprot:233754-Pyramimonas_sp.AAC.1